jgi:hypothetical protein
MIVGVSMGAEVAASFGYCFFKPITLLAPENLQQT